jgi:hypothetical protein
MSNSPKETAVAQPWLEHGMTLNEWISDHLNMNEHFQQGMSEPCIKALCQQLVQEATTPYVQPGKTACIAPTHVGFRLCNDTEASQAFNGTMPMSWAFRCPTVGSMVCQGADRAPDYDHGFVVGMDWSNATVGVIYPRFHIPWNADKQTMSTIELGTDRMTNAPFQYPVNCVCEIYQGCDFCCSCGAEDANVKEYAKSFKVCDKQTYQISWLPLDKHTGYSWMEFPTKPANQEQIPQCQPLCGTACLACRDSHAR